MSDGTIKASSTLGGAGYSLNGQSVGHVLSPATVDELRELLRDADQERLSTVPWGGGTQMGLGNVAGPFDVAVDLRRLNNLVQYEPDDLTVAVQAGCTLGELNRRLAEHGQMLPVDAAHPDDATVGGLFAAGISGPRRLGYGPLRDLAIGITFVTPDGTLAKGGGMVVKNVSGFDMMRLHYGALGAYGVIVQLNFKVLPAPRAQSTVVARFADLEQASAVADTVRLSQLGPTALVLLNEHAAVAAGLDAAPWTLLLRGEAPPAAAIRQAERMIEVCSESALAVDRLEEQAMLPVWDRVNLCLSATPDDSLGIRLGAPTSRMSAVIEQARTILGGEQSSCQMTADFGSALCYLRLPDQVQSPAVLADAWPRLSQLGEHATLLTAPVVVRRETDVFGKQPAGIALMQNLKRQFDPNGTLNRGRFVGGI